MTKVVKKNTGKILLQGNGLSKKDDLSCQCLKCRYEWVSQWYRIERGKGCPRCLGRVKWTTGEIKAKLRLISPTISIIGEYTGAFDPLKCRCRRCRLEWSPTWTNLQKGQGCPRCFRKSQRFTISGIKSKLKELNPDLVIVGKYKEAFDQLKIKCRKCQHQWTTTWNTLSRIKRYDDRTGCPQCGLNRCIQKSSLTHEEVARRLKRLNPNVKLLDRYQQRSLPLKCYCRKCGSSWKRTWYYITQTNGKCPSCCPIMHHSEAKVRKIIERLTGWGFPKCYPTFLKGHNGGSLELDGYNEEHKVAFEYQGLQHYRLCYWNRFDPQKLREQKRRDWRKKYQCWYHGIKLIRVPYWVEDVESFITGKL